MVTVSGARKEQKSVCQTDFAYQSVIDLHRLLYYSTYLVFMRCGDDTSWLSVEKASQNFSR